jgi:hypothetical protein
LEAALRAFAKCWVYFGKVRGAAWTKLSDGAARVETAHEVGMNSPRDCCARGFGK